MKLRGMFLGGNIGFLPQNNNKKSYKETISVVSSTEGAEMSAKLGIQAPHIISGTDLPLDPCPS